MATVATKTTTLSVGDGASPEVFTAIPCATSISVSGRQVTQIDVTCLEDTSMKYTSGLLENGSLSTEILYDPNDAQHTQLRTDHEAGTQRNYQISVPTSPVTTLTFAANVETFDYDAQINQVWKVSTSLKISGAITQA